MFAASESVAGVVTCPSVLGLVEFGDARGVSVSLSVEICVLLLLLCVGMEMDLNEFARWARHPSSSR